MKVLFRGLPLARVMAEGATMKKGSTWPKNCNSRFLHEKVVMICLAFVVIVLSLDCFFQNLPISRYGLVVITLVLIGCTTCLTCHGIKWVISSERPLDVGEGWGWGAVEGLFAGAGGGLESLKYPTNLNEQVRLLIKDVERDFVKSWYSEISQNPSFLFDSHLMLEEIFLKIINKLKSMRCKNVIASILIVYLNHLQEYKKWVKKRARLSEGERRGKAEASEVRRHPHPGSQSDQVLNYYLKKVARSLLKEFASHEFAGTVECKILSNIIGRKVFGRLLTTAEDPDWINLKVMCLVNGERHGEILGSSAYVVKDKGPGRAEEEARAEEGAPGRKRYSELRGGMFGGGRALFEGEGGREALRLPLGGGRGAPEEGRGNISSVLSGLISSTAGPLIAENISVRCKAFNKMWQSPVSEVTKDISESVSSSFQKVFESMKEKKGIGRSRSTESLSEPSGGPRAKDVSVGEELCESGCLAAAEAGGAWRKAKRLTKTRSFDGDGLTAEEASDGEEAKAGGNADGDAGGDGQRDVSPVYEEPEDFATTIAKLRSLLQQRESNSTPSDRSGASVESQTGATSRSECSGRSWEGESPESQTACDVPTDGRLFVNVCVPRGELVSEAGGSPFVLYTVQYDGIYVVKDERGSSEQELVLQTTVVKRRFQEFLRLQAKLEESSSHKALMKGVKGPSRWVQSNAGVRTGEEATGSSRRAMLESFLRQLCSKVEISNSQELHEFLGYGQSGSESFIKKGVDCSPHRIDKLLANKVTGVFNSIKTALPSFDFESAATVATNDAAKGFQEQKLLQNLLNFGNKPEMFELKLCFLAKESTGESFADDVRSYLSEKSDCVEDAVDVLDSSDWLSETRECRFVSGEDKCVWDGYRDVLVEDELEPLDSWLPVYSLILDIVCELLQDSDSWAIKEPVIRLVKVVSGHWEEKLEKQMSALDWDRIFANVIRLVRGAIFPCEEGEAAEVTELETAKHLKEVVAEVFPGWTKEFVKEDGMSSAISLFVDSFQHFRLNRDVLLRLMDVLLVQLLSCNHLTSESRR